LKLRHSEGIKEIRSISSYLQGQLSETENPAQESSYTQAASTEELLSAFGM